MPTRYPAIDQPGASAQTGGPPRDFPDLSGNRRPARLVCQQRGLRLKLALPTNTSVAGDVDANGAPRIHELLARRLASTVETMVLDLSQVRFLGVVGLDLLDHVRTHAACGEITMCLVDGPVCVDRALRAAGWGGVVRTYPTVDAAVAETIGRDAPAAVAS